LGIFRDKLSGEIMTQLSLIIRPLEHADARDINTMRRIPQIAENLIALPSESLIQNEKFIADLTDDDHVFCAQTIFDKQPRVIGLAGLHVRKLARERHTAVLGIMIHPEFHGQGVGTKLMQTIIDLADNWLLLKRIDLTVFPDNFSAIKLYEKFNFVVEGTMKYASTRRGKLADHLLMARYCVT